MSLNGRYGFEYSPINIVLAIMTQVKTDVNDIRNFLM
jgi:hypothetical protein